MSLNVVDEREKDEQGNREKNQPGGENVLVRCLEVFRKDEFARFEQPEEKRRQPRFVLENDGRGLRICRMDRRCEGGESDDGIFRFGMRRVHLETDQIGIRPIVPMREMLERDRPVIIEMPCRDDSSILARVIVP